MTRKYRMDFSLAFNADDLDELQAATLDDERDLAALAQQCAQYDRDYILANDIHEEI